MRTRAQIHAPLPVCLLVALGCGPSERPADLDGGAGGAPAAAQEAWPERDFLRIATFNIQELTAEKIFATDSAGIGAHPQARAAAGVIQRVRPDVLVLNELDHYYGQGLRGLSAYAHRFVELYLETGSSPLSYPFVLIAPNNTGIPSGLDLNGDGLTAGEGDEGTRAYGEDAFGFGLYPGQYSIVVLSRYPMDGARSRTFRTFRWRDLPGHHMPPAYYSPEAEAAMRLSSKSHMDLPLVLGDRVLHLWVSHPTPPAFDGEEDRNGRRNFDEIRFWKLYLEGSEALYDDQGRRGGFTGDAPFVIAGDLNARPGATASNYDGRTAISQLLDHPRVRDPGHWVTSRGALQGGPPGPPGHRERATAEFLGGVRVDYVLPSVDLEVVGGGVFWPDPVDDPEGAALAETASDHRLVWIDIRLPEASATP